MVSASLLSALPAPAERALSHAGLTGTLTLAPGLHIGTAALILAGSGPVDRDGNAPSARNDSLKLLAHGLAAHGLATLRVDKRGIAGSGGVVREEELRFETYVADAVAWLDRLGAETGADRLAIIGHSEGALVATLAARRRDLAALVLVAGAGEPAPAVIARQLAAANLPPELLNAFRGIAEALSRGDAVAEVPAALAPLYRPSVQPYLMSWFPLDPAAELAKVACEVLIVQGSADLQIGEADARRLAAANPAAQLVVIPGMNHVLKAAPGERAANLATYGDPALPLAPGLVEAIARFLRGG
ncbi:alpha/beta hydrolase [Blastochloris viridis]|uniref:Esterase/lipase n=1 Tax=Blastochloris viridis TaxID=1079 RepID=A0A0H5BNR2_BLAVI|nr:alpha/beta fold hydrolase [Blastochloris viridis]ALK08625.1 Alpha/beta hydrolase family protein [Blastochloris viridis]BAR98083.1 hydrolase [Blastochloris viridis]CUU41288.1 Esterase/lipase [Blastochloris viridis]